ncbi:MAG: patatin-like phospholipase family protein [bacterium]
MYFRKFPIVFLLLAVAAQYSFAQTELQRSLGKKPHLALVLSGGGARGFAHIGVLEILDSAQIPFDLIVGTSMGAILGGLYAAGYSPAELERMAIKTNWGDVFNLSDDSHRPERSFGKKDEKLSLLSLRFNGFITPVLPQAISSGQRLTMLLNSLVIGSPFGIEDDFLHNMRVPFVSLATDIVTGSRRILTHGDLTGAIRASATVPLRFNPLAKDSALLVDGGLLSNIPVDIAKDSASADFVIVSNTTADLRNRSEITSPFDVADQVITLMMRKENLEAMKRADVVITPELEHGKPDDFSNANLYIQAGKEAARKSLPQIRALLDLPVSSSETLHSVDDNILSSVITQCRIISRLRLDSLQSYGQLLIGKSFSKNSFKKILEIPLLAYMRKLGYSLARIESVRIDPIAQRADIFLDEGRTGLISVKGLSSVKEALVKNEFSISTGDIFRLNAAESGIRNLTATGYFSFASLELIHSPYWTGTRFFSSSDTNLPRLTLPAPSPSLTNLQISVTERATQILRLGGFADNEFGGQFSMQYANENLFGYGTEVSLTAGIGNSSRYAIARMSTPQLFFSFTTCDFELYGGFADIPTYSLRPDVPSGKIRTQVSDVLREERDIGGRLRLGGEVSRLALLTGEIRVERQRSSSTKTLAPVELEQTLTALRGELTVDSRDDGDFPHEGTLIKSNYEIGTGLLGGAKRYTKIFATLEPSLPVSRLHTFIPKIAIGIGDRTLPRLEQFDLGGIESFYGLNAFALRGKQMVKGSLTYQVAIPDALFFPTFVSFRYDLGAMWVEPESIKFRNFIHGIGAQVGFKTPIGIARFAIGENFQFAESTSHPVLFNSPIFYFSIGAKL